MLRPQVMAIGRTFEEALQKALRMTDTSVAGFESCGIDLPTEKDLDHALAVASDMRIYAIALAFERGYTVQRIHALTNIDHWFLCVEMLYHSPGLW